MRLFGMLRFGPGVHNGAQTQHRLDGDTIAGEYDSSGNLVAHYAQGLGIVSSADSSVAPLLDTWSHPLAVGQPLPSLPVWLSETQSVVLDLESSYKETCRVLRIS